MMKRRDFISLIGGTAAWPLAALAQSGGQRKIAILALGTPTNPAYQSSVTAFTEGLRDLGWADGQKAHIDLRWGSGNADLEKSFAAELVKLAPDVILACGTANLTFLQQATPSIPIVFVQVSDPVAQHFVPNLTRPGGNITGFAAFEFSIGGKWIELLKQVAPALERVGLLFNPDVSPQNEYQLQAMTKDAPAFGVEIVPLRVHSDAEIEAAMANLAGRPNGGLVLPTDNYAISREKLISELALRHRLPSISGNESSFVEAGGLMYYGYQASLIGQYRAAAGYVDRILKGAKPGELPIQLPTKFQFVVNLKTAKALGLTVPPSVFAGADEVIE
jgi:putative tryptophan/tyrosine transport system substrate-binding protein